MRFAAVAWFARLRFAAFAVCGDCGLRRLRGLRVCGLRRLRFAAFAVCGDCGLRRFRFAAIAVCGDCGLRRLRLARLRFAAFAVCGDCGVYGLRVLRFAAFAVGGVCGVLRLFAAFSERFFTDPGYISRKIRKFRRINSIRETAGLLMCPGSLKRGSHSKIKARFTLSVV